MGNSKATIDQLVYNYNNENYGNRLINVSDSKGNLHVGDFVDGNTVGNINDYEYNQSGELVHDRNRGISIAYDPILHKPTKISLDSDPSGKFIEYI